MKFVFNSPRFLVAALIGLMLASPVSRNWSACRQTALHHPQSTITQLEYRHLEHRDPNVLLFEPER